MTVDERQNPDGHERDSGDATTLERLSSRDVSNGEGSATAQTPEPPLASRVLVTWIEVTLVGITGGLLGNTISGPPGFIVYLITTLLTIGIIFHNVNELIKAWLRRGAQTE